MYTHTIVVTENGTRRTVIEEQSAYSVTDDNLEGRVEALMQATPDLEDASYFIDSKLWYYVHRSYFLFKHN